jgi:hypothetical protein
MLLALALPHSHTGPIARSPGKVPLLGALILVVSSKPVRYVALVRVYMRIMYNNSHLTMANGHWVISVAVAEKSGPRSA